MILAIPSGKVDFDRNTTFSRRIPLSLYCWLPLLLAAFYFAIAVAGSYFQAV